MTRISVGAYNGVIRTGKNTGSKFNNKKTEYNGEKYDSKKEAQYARELDMLSRAQNDAERVVEWERQLPYRLDVNGVHICKYVLDFKVTYADGRVEHVDVKGYKQGGAYRTFVFKKKLMKAVHGIEVIEK